MAPTMAMVMAQPWGVVTNHLTKHANRQEHKYNPWSATEVEQYEIDLDGIDNSENSDSNYIRQEQRSLQDCATVCIINRHYLGFGWPFLY